jgi:hypothetical protein
MSIPMGNVEFRQESYQVDDSVFAYPSLRILRGSALDHARLMEGIILGINTDGSLEIGFFIGPMPYDAIKHEIRLQLWKTNNELGITNLITSYVI